MLFIARQSTGDVTPNGRDSASRGSQYAESAAKVQSLPNSTVLQTIVEKVLPNGWGNRL
jgi:hypothetical protein